jgi:hypothetical protein
MTPRKPGIPPVNTPACLPAVVECLEVIMGRRGGSIQPINSITTGANDSNLANVLGDIEALALKVNEIISRLGDGA